MRHYHLRIIVFFGMLAGAFTCSCAGLSIGMFSGNLNSADTAAVLYSQGRQLAAEGRLAEAEVPLQRAVLLEPRNVSLLTLLGKVEARLGKSKDAALLFRRVVEADPASAAAHLDLGIALADEKDLSGALEEVTEAVKLAPMVASGHLNRARLLSDSGRIAEARKEFATACRIDPHNPECFFLWGSFELANQQASAATPLLRKVVAIQPDNYEAYFLLAKSLDLQKHKPEAIEMWRRAVALKPDDQEAVYALFQALRESDRTASAKYLAEFNELQAKNERLDQVRDLGNKAYAAMQVQDWNSAITILTQAIKLCQSCEVEADLYQHLGIAECNSGNLDDCEVHLRRALTMKPDDTVTVQELEWVVGQRERRGSTNP